MFNFIDRASQKENGRFDCCLYIKPLALNNNANSVIIQLSSKILSRPYLLFERLKTTTIQILCIAALSGLALLVPFGAKAQAYRTALGVRAGTELGLTLQQRVIEKATIEGIVTTNRYRWQAQGLFEYHRPVLGKRVNVYLGAGPHFGNEKGYGDYWGITPVAGVEITLLKFVISYDYKPSFNLGGGSTYLFHDSGISVRMVLIKQKRKTPIKDFFEKTKRNKD